MLTGLPSRLSWPCSRLWLLGGVSTSLILFWRSENGVSCLLLLLVGKVCCWTCGFTLNSSGIGAGLVHRPSCCWCRFSTSLKEQDRSGGFGGCTGKLGFLAHGWLAPFGVVGVLFVWNELRWMNCCCCWPLAVLLRDDWDTVVFWLLRWMVCDMFS